MSEDKVVYPVETWIVSDYYRHSPSGKYFGTPLPESIEEKPFKLNEDNYITFKLVKETPPFIRARKFEGSENETGRYEMSIQKRSDRHPPYFVQFPSEFTEYNEDSPVHDISKGDILNVELNYATAELRIYRAEDYGHRNQELSTEGEPPLVKAPYVIGLFSGAIDSIERMSSEDKVWINSLPSSALQGDVFKVKGFATGPEIDEIVLQVRNEGDIIWDHWKTKNCNGEMCSIEGVYEVDEPGNLEFKVTVDDGSRYDESDIEKVKVWSL